MRTKSEVIVTCEEDFHKEPLRYRDLEPGSYFKFVNVSGFVEGDILKKVGTANTSYVFLYFSLKDKWYWSSTSHRPTLDQEVILYDVCLRATRASC